MCVLFTQLQMSFDSRVVQEKQLEEIKMLTYDVATMTLENFRDLIASGNDEYDNQIRVSKEGKIYLSQGITGAISLDGVAFRCETFDAGNDYVGIEASKDDRFIIPLFKAIKDNWAKGCPKTYLDDWAINFAD